MVEVFRTQVKDQAQAHNLTDHIHRRFRNYQANFDLDDCDKILRVECLTGPVQSLFLIRFLKDLGCQAEILSDELPVFGALINNTRIHQIYSPTF